MPKRLTDRKLDSYDLTPRLCAKGIDCSAYKFAANGNLIMPDAPGFGLKLA